MFAAVFLFSKGIKAKTEPSPRDSKWRRKKTYNENEIKILRENTEIVQLWMKNDPKKLRFF